MSCKKSFLELTPKGMVIAQTTNDYDLMFNSLNLLNMNTDAQVPLGDDAAASSTYFAGAALRTQRLFEYDAAVYDNGQSAPEMLVPMQSIYLYNTVINSVIGSSGGSTAQKQALQAEAMADRAWTYFLLINYYGKPYDSTTAATDPGFPIIKTSDVTTTSFTRASVQQVYDFIVSDLTTAIPNLGALSFRTRMSKAAAEALLGKVYVFMRKFDQAIPLLNTALADLNGSSVTVRLYNYNTDMQPGGVMALSASTGLPGLILLPNSLENIFARQFSNSWSNTYGIHDILLSPQTYSLYDPSDLRRVFFSNTILGQSNALPPGVYYRDYPSQTMIGMTLPDFYLLKAEAEARVNDLATAKTDVETVRNARMPAANAAVPANTATDQVALVKFILDERTREFALQGYRWFDMRRLSIDPTYSGVVNTTHTVYNNDGTISATYNLTTDRYVLQFPSLVIQQNPGMQNNP